MRLSDPAVADSPSGGWAEVAVVSIIAVAERVRGVLETFVLQSR
jgi:hypothetical protein